MAEENGFIGTCLGNYRITGELGSGSFGYVYSAEHTILTERTVAIKLLHSHLANSEERERFLQEARLLERLKYPHILHVIDVGIHSGFPYLVTEYAPSGSLRNLIQRYRPDPVPVHEALRVLTQVGQALSYAHQQNIIHRDLKPENILFNLQGEALLADFGIATTLSTSSIKNVTITGTPSYMAPEQFESSVSRESDQYALGCIAYELFTGRPPFVADNFFSMGLDHLTKEPAAPSRYNSQIPMHIEQAILKAMSKQRHARYADIQAFINALYQPGNAEQSLPTVLSAQSAANVEQADTIKPDSQKHRVPSINIANTPATVHVELQKRPHVTGSNQYGVSDKPNSFHQNPETPFPTVYPLYQQTSSQEVETQRAFGHPNPETPVPQVKADVPFHITESPFLQQAPFEGSQPFPAMNGIQYTNGAIPSTFPIKQSNRRNWWRIVAFIGLLILVLPSIFITAQLLFFHGFSPTLTIIGNQPTSQASHSVPSGITATSIPTSIVHKQPSHTPTTILNTAPTTVPTVAGTTGSNNSPVVTSPATATPIPTTAPTATTVPTTAPTANPTPSPTRTPVTETLTLYFINGMSGTSTVNSYSGNVTIHVWGEGEEYTNKWYDAFYQYTDAHGNPITPYHTSVYPGWTLWINGSVADNYVSIPAYNSSHDYTVTMNAPGGTLTFAIGDTYPKDNSGYLTLTVTQN